MEFGMSADIVPVPPTFQEFNIMASTSLYDQKVEKCTRNNYHCMYQSCSCNTASNHALWAVFITWKRMSCITLKMASPAIRFETYFAVEALINER